MSDEPRAPRPDDAAARDATGASEAPGAAGGTPAPDEVWDLLPRWRAEGRRFVLATVVETRGFTPRRPGARMLIGDDGAIAGTIGGGAIEHLVRGEAAKLLERGGTGLVRRHLTQELGMCCGGAMAVFLEAIEPAPRLLVLGAGYIAQPLAQLARTCGFEVTVMDGREEWGSAERFPGCRVIEQDPEDALRAFATTPRDYAVICTHDHALDQRLVEALLPRPLRFIGMIGSRAKQRKFALRLRARGFTDADIARVHTPLGVAIGAESPEEIAVSAMAVLIAVRRGTPVEAPWAPPQGAGRTDAGAAPGVAGVAGADAPGTEASTEDTHPADAAEQPADAALTRLLRGLAAGGAARDEEVTP
jgi:xanthine dehydrogenase accessory factor